MEPTDLIIFLAGLIGGLMNSLAGGGSTVTIAVLAASGVPPLIANSTNTLAAMIGYGVGVYRLRHEISVREALPYLGYAVIGGVAGAFALRLTPEGVFREIVPYLLLGATALFAVNAKTEHWSVRLAPLAMPLLLIASVYGGYFQAGLGIILLACLSQITPQLDLVRLTALKLLISLANAAAASIILIQADLINWRICLILMLGLALGGDLGARSTMSLPPRFLKPIILAICLGVTLPLFF